MNASHPSRTLIFEQLAETAPAVSRLLQTYSARLHVDLVSGDVLNGYGNSLSLKISAQVLLERCKLCGETQFTAPVFTCRGHRVENVWFILADAEGAGFDLALIKLEPQIEAWLRERTR